MTPEVPRPADALATMDKMTRKKGCQAWIKTKNGTGNF